MEALKTPEWSGRPVLNDPIVDAEATTAKRAVLARVSSLESTFKQISQSMKLGKSPLCVWFKFTVWTNSKLKTRKPCSRAVEKRALGFSSSNRFKLCRFVFCITCWLLTFYPPYYLQKFYASQLISFIFLTLPAHSIQPRVNSLVFILWYL